MPRTLELFDPSAPLILTAMRHHLDFPLVEPVEGVGQIELSGDDKVRFLGWASTATWRPEFERDLQCISQDAEGRAHLSTWLPLITVRESFFSGGREKQNAETAELMTCLREQTRHWREAGCDQVDFSGRFNESSL